MCIMTKCVFVYLYWYMLVDPQRMHSVIQSQWRLRKYTVRGDFGIVIIVCVTVSLGAGA